MIGPQTSQITMKPQTLTYAHDGQVLADHFEQIVSDYQQSLYRFAYSLAKSTHEADDIVQQTFYIYASKGSSLRDPSKIKSWLFTTLYREFLRRKRDRNRLESRDPEILEAIAGSTETDVHRRLDAQLAVEALQEVDPTYRAPLALFYLNDLSYQEIANSLSIPIGTVMSRLSRGKSRLREVFQQKTSSAACFSHSS